MLFSPQPKTSPYLLLLCVLSVFLPAGVGFAAQPSPEVDIQRLRDNVIALDRVQRNIHKEIQARKIAASISTLESNELLIFAAYLQERNREYCSQLSRLGGEAARAQIPCPPEQATLPETTAKTTNEELAELEQRLSESLGAFDDMLLREQTKVASRQPRQRESGGGGAGVAGTSTSEETSPNQQAAGDQQQGQSGTTKNSGSTGQTDGRIGNVSSSQQEGMYADDDIVARQLREAAQKETDPELKQKLWDEYRKYKSGK